MPQNQGIDLSTQAPESFTQQLNLQVAPYHAPQQRPSGMMGGLGKAAFYGTQILEGISKGKAVAFAREEDKRNRQLQTFLGMANMIRSRPDLTDEQRTAVDNQIMQVVGRGMQSSLSGEKGKKEDKGAKDSPIGKIKELFSSIGDKMAGGPYKAGSPVIDVPNAMALLQASVSGPSRSALSAQAQGMMDAGYREVVSKLPPGQVPTNEMLFANPRFQAGQQEMHRVDPAGWSKVYPDYFKYGTEKPNEAKTGQLTDLRIGKEKRIAADDEQVRRGMKKLEDSDARMVDRPQPTSGATAPATSPDGKAEEKPAPVMAMFSERADDPDIRAAISKKPSGFNPPQDLYLLDENDHPIQAVEMYLPDRYQIRGTSVDVRIPYSAAVGETKGYRIGKLPPKAGAPQIRWDFDKESKQYYQIERDSPDKAWKPSAGPGGARITKPYNAPPDVNKQAYAEVNAVLGRKRVELSSIENNFTRFKQSTEGRTDIGDEQKKALITGAQANLENRKTEVENNARQHISAIASMNRITSEALQSLTSPPESMVPSAEDFYGGSNK